MVSGPVCPNKSLSVCKKEATVSSSAVTLKFLILRGYCWPLFYVCSAHTIVVYRSPSKNENNIYEVSSTP